MVTDWSDAEIRGPGEAVGRDTATELLRGCIVHWSRSWQRVRDCTARSYDKTREKAAFSLLASQISELEGGENVAVLKHFVENHKPFLLLE